jgi:hypothetical protein
MTRPVFSIVYQHNIAQSEHMGGLCLGVAA